MIKVERCTEPEILASSKQAWLRCLTAATTDRQRKKIQNKYKHPAVRAALELSFSRKCAYCESYIRHVGFGHIEHFRPKSNQRYSNLVFEWTNLLLACEVCNSDQKGTQFPEVIEDGPIIDPCSEDPTSHLSFEYDSTAGLATVGFLTIRGETTIRVLGLNRPDLREHRSLFVKKLYVLASLAKGDSAAEALLLQATWSNAEYAAFARRLLPS